MTENLPPLKVLIVGGGVSGLFMAILLERAGINYVVIEKQKTFKPSARSVCLSAVVFPVLEQLGLLQDIKEIAKPVGAFLVVTHKYDKIGELSLRSFEERYGYATMILPRPSFYNILLSRIPKEKIVLGRRVLSIAQSANGVLVRCGDGTNYSGDILIGADGGNSSIRQNLYKHIESSGGNNILYPQYSNLGKKGSSSNINQLTNHPPPPAQDGSGGRLGGGSNAQKSGDHPKLGLFACPSQAKKTKFLPESDLQPMEYDAYKITGLTCPMDALPDTRESNFTIVVGKDRKYTLWLIPMADRRLGWSIDLNLHNKRTSKDQEGAFKLSDYGPETVEDIVSEFRDHPSHVPGVTLGDIFDASPPHLLMRAVMHQKVFETWYGGRTVLVGEACHKFVPTAGQSDICNIADCVTLVNLLHELKSNTLSDIQAMFETYRSERHPVARRALEVSRQTQALYTSNGLLVSLLRKITFKRGVDFMYCKMNDIAHARRLLVTFLAFPTPRGIFRRIDPTPSSRTLDHLPVFNSYEATKAYLAKANQAIQNQQAASDEARRTLELQNEESRLYHYHHSYRQPFTSGSILSGSASGSSHLDEQSPSYAGEYIDPYDASSSRSSSLSRERSGFGSQFSYSNKSDTL